MNTILTRLSAELIRKYEAEGFWRGDTIYSLVRGHAERAPDSLAVRDRFRRVTYRQLRDAADTFAADLAARGVIQGQRVAVWLPSRIESVVALLACSRNGYVCCPSLHRDHTVGEVVELLQRVRCVAMVLQNGYGADSGKHDVTAALQEVPTLKHAYRLQPLTEDSPFPAIHAFRATSKGRRGCPAQGRA
jgi:acyl-CoA synthetase